MRTYLSVDLDFWSYRTWDHMIDFLASLPTDNLRVSAEHHSLLPHVNRTAPDLLWNMDYHSDITDHPDNDSPALNCGTWVNFVKRVVLRKSRYVWVRPNKQLVGSEQYCHRTCYKNRSPFLNPDFCSWTKLPTMLWQGNIGAHIPGQIMAIGIACSQEWIRCRNESDNACQVCIAKAALGRKSRPSCVLCDHQCYFERAVESRQKNRKRGKQ